MIARARAWYVMRVRIPLSALRLAVSTYRHEIRESSQS